VPHALPAHDYFFENREKIRAIVKLTELLIVHFLPPFSHTVLDPDMLVQ
jgi:hypothetical protein